MIDGIIGTLLEWLHGSAYDASRTYPFALVTSWILCERCDASGSHPLRLRAASAVLTRIGQRMNPARLFPPRIGCLSQGCQGQEVLVAFSCIRHWLWHKFFSETVVFLRPHKLGLQSPASRHFAGIIRAHLKICKYLDRSHLPTPRACCPSPRTSIHHSGQSNSSFAGREWRA